MQRGTTSNKAARACVESLVPSAGVVSTALMKVNNIVAYLDLTWINIGDDGVRYLSMALVNENNKVVTLDLHDNDIGVEGIKSFSTALMIENNKLTTLNLTYNNIGTPCFAALLKGLQFSLVSYLEIGIQIDLNKKVKRLLKRFINGFNKYIFVLSVSPP